MLVSFDKDKINKPSVETIEEVYLSILQSPLTYRAIGMSFLRRTRAEIELKTNRKAEHNNPEDEKIANLKEKFETLLVSESFKNALRNRAKIYEEKVYKLNRINLRIKDNLPSVDAYISLAFNLNEVIDIQCEKNLEWQSKYENSLDDSEIILARRLVSARIILSIGFEYFDKCDKDFLYPLYSKICRYIGEYSQRYFGAFTEIDSWCDEDYKSGLELIYCVSQNPEVTEYLKIWESYKEPTQDNINILAKKFLKSIRKNNTKLLVKCKSISSKPVNSVAFFEEIIILVEKFVKYSPLIKTEEPLKITQEQMYFISQQTYWEIQRLKINEENPDIISLYNRRLVELVSQGIENAVELVIEIPKLQLLYLQKNYQGFLWAMNSMTEIEFINNNGINPNGLRVLERLKVCEFESITANEDSDERKIILDISDHIKKSVEDLKLSGGIHEVRAAKKFYYIVAEIEKYGGVSQFWFNFLCHKNSLSYNIHIGRNKNGRNFDRCALITLAEGYGVAVHRKTNQIIFVGDYHPG